MTRTRTINLMEPILKANDAVATRLRHQWARTGTLAINLMSAPGAGKTTLLEATLSTLYPQYRVLVLEGDIETERDAERIRRLGVPAHQITTGGTCHLEAQMITAALEALKTDTIGDFLFIENVGNLVCPASYDLGEHLRVVLLSVPEGDDKPKKYPKAFRTASVFVITKIDLLPHFDFDLDRVRNEALDLNPDLHIFALSPKTGEGMTPWIDFLRQTHHHLTTTIRSP